MSNKSKSILMLYGASAVYAARAVATNVTRDPEVVYFDEADTITTEMMQAMIGVDYSTLEDRVIDSFRGGEINTSRLNDRIPNADEPMAYIKSYQDGPVDPGEGKHYMANRLGKVKAVARRRAANKAARKARRKT